MIQFDDLGYITPYEVHELTLEEFERTFVIDSERERLFKSLMNFVLDLKNFGAGEFYIWVDGSFVTKKRVPGDIDLVCFIHFSQFENISTHLDQLRKRYEESLDIFLAPHYPENHPGSNETVLRKLTWKEGFGYDRLHRKKGFIELNF